MDIFTRFNRKNIDDRQIDTLIGLSKGLLADGKVDQAEAEVLLNWLAQSSTSTNNPIIHNLLETVGSFLSDNHLDEDESAELVSLLQRISGEETELGEFTKTTTLPLCDPAPTIIFTNKNFLYTGTFAFGTRKQCKAASESLGGISAKGVTYGLDYLVLGSYVTDSWIHENFGRKIEKAMNYRSEGAKLSIVSETHWANLGGFS